MGIKIQPTARDEVNGYSWEHLFEQHRLILEGKGGHSRKMRDLIQQRVANIQAQKNTSNSEILIKGIAEFKATQMAGTPLMCVIADIIYMDQMKASTLPNSPLTVKDGELYLNGAVLISLSKYRKHFDPDEDFPEEEFRVKPLKLQK